MLRIGAIHNKLSIDISIFSFGNMFKSKPGPSSKAYALSDRIIASTFIQVQVSQSCIPPCNIVLANITCTHALNRRVYLSEGPQPIIQP